MFFRRKTSTHEAQSSAVTKSVMRRGSRVAILVGLLQGFVIAVGWYAMYQTTHEQVAAGVEDIIVQNNEQMARSIIEGIGGLDEDVEFGSATWLRLQDIVERVELNNGGFACIVDGEGHIVCHPEMRKNPSLRDINLSTHMVETEKGLATALKDLKGDGISTGSMDFLFDGKHYVATQALRKDGTRLIVHQPVSGLTAASKHLTSGLILQAVVLGFAIVGLTILMVFFVIRMHNSAVLRWNAELDEKVRLRTAEVREALDAAKLAASVKSEFLANMSHEIRTPMNGVLGMIDVLAQTDLDEDQVELVNTIRNSGSGLLELLGDVLEYSSAATTSPIAARSDSFDLAELMDDCRRLVSPAAEAKALPIGLMVGEGLPPSLMGDPDRLRQVLRKLLSNAVSFTEMGRIDLSVERAELDTGESSEGDEVTLCFQVTDTGMGIPPEEHEHIFESFTQVDGSTTREIGGIGMGLTVARAHAALMGGRLELVSSEVGQGSVFALTLGFTVAHVPEPSEPVTEASAELSEGSTPSTAAVPSTGPLPNAKAEPKGKSKGKPKAKAKLPASKPHVTDETRNAHVLVVEDNKLNQRVAVSYLERMGCNVSVANNGKEGLDSVADEIFDVVLMDCQMPVMGGLDATRAIRALPSPVCDVPIVALTAHALPEEKSAAHDAGMDDYMTKPVDFESLRTMIGRWRGGRLLGTS